MNTTNLKSFHYLENGEIMFSALETRKSSKILDPGSYVLSTKATGMTYVPYIRCSKSEEARVHMFADKSKVDSLLEAFFNKNVQGHVSSLGFNHKVGVLFHGRQGGGKTSIIRWYCDKLMKEHDAIVFDLIPKEPNLAEIAWKFAQDVRAVQKNPIVFIMDECDEFFEHRGAEGILKTMLDGNLSIDNSVVMASTNYLHKIPEAVRDRPSRFKHVICVEGIQSEEEIYQIVEKMIGILHTPEEIRKYSHSLKGSTLDEIKQFCLDKIMDLQTYSKERNQIGFFRKN